MMKNKAVTYVDGSYNKKEDLCGWVFNSLNEI